VLTATPFLPGDNVPQLASRQVTSVSNSHPVACWNANINFLHSNTVFV